jgi:hypothetical protein
MTPTQKGEKIARGCVETNIVKTDIGVILGFPSLLSVVHSLGPRVRPHHSHKQLVAPATALGGDLLYLKSLRCP